MFVPDGSDIPDCRQERGRDRYDGRTGRTGGGRRGEVRTYGTPSHQLCDAKYQVVLEQSLLLSAHQSLTGRRHECFAAERLMVDINGVEAGSISPGMIRILATVRGPRSTVLGINFKLKS